MAGAESSEEITFEFDELEFEYQRTDPYTGLKKGEADITRPRLKNYPPAKEPAVGETGGVNPSVTPSAGGTGGPGTVGGATSSGGPAGNGQHPGIATPTDLSLLANFPGAAPLNGPGVLQQT